MPADLAQHTLLEEDDHRPSAEFLGWRHWLRVHGVPQLEPARWMLLNFTYQQMQAALSGQGVALARLPLVGRNRSSAANWSSPSGRRSRIVSPFAYWLIEWPRGAACGPKCTLFARWLLAQAEQTRRDTDLAVNAAAA